VFLSAGKHTGKQFTRTDKSIKSRTFTGSLLSNTEAKMECQSQSHIATDGQSVLVSSHIWGSRTDIYYCLVVTVLFLWCALSDERTGLSFVYAAGLCQRSLSWVRVPWDLRPYFTVSDLRLLFASSPTTRRVTVEVFDPASIRYNDSTVWPCL
jgi:hypothetical protein